MLDQQETEIDHVRIIPYHSFSTSGRTIMPAIHEIATLTSKGQVTLPNPFASYWGLIPVARSHSTCAGVGSWSAA